MKRSLIVAGVFGIATIALLGVPGFFLRIEAKTIGKHDVDLSKTGETVLPIPDVRFCCGSELLLFLAPSVECDRDRVVRELLKPANLTCEILNPNKEIGPIEIDKHLSWSGPEATKMLFLGSECPPLGRGEFVRLKLAEGCSGLTGIKQTLVLRQTPCHLQVVAGYLPFVLGAFVTGLVAAIALIVALYKFIKKKRLEKSESNKTLQQTARAAAELER